MNSKAGAAAQLPFVPNMPPPCPTMPPKPVLQPGTESTSAEARAAKKAWFKLNKAHRQYAMFMQQHQPAAFLLLTDDSQVLSASPSPASSRPPSQQRVPVVDASQSHTAVQSTGQTAASLWGGVGARGAGQTAAPSWRGTGARGTRARGASGRGDNRARTQSRGGGATQHRARS